MNGDHAEAAQLLSELAGSSSDAAQQAVSEAVSAGDFNLALSLISRSRMASRSLESRLLLAADALRRHEPELAEQWLGSSADDLDPAFWDPIITAWADAERADGAAALSALAAVPQTTGFASVADEQRALILLKLGRTAEAEPVAQRALDRAGEHEFQLRLELAAGFEAAGDRTRALQMIEGVSDPAAIKTELESGRLNSLRVDSAAKAFSEELLTLAIDLQRAQEVGSDSFDIVQIARFAWPGNSAATITSGLLLDQQGAADRAIAAFASIPAGDPLKSQALDDQARSLIDAKRFDEALALADASVRGPSATAADYARLGDVLSSMKRYDAAADAYQQAASRSQGIPEKAWPLLLRRADALESAHRRPEAKQVTEQALALAPNQPEVLNFLGYDDLVHGEDLKTADALIRKASALDPDDPSITDSLGWALYKQGRIGDAIDTLQKAAAGDPVQSEIQEHLGDALYTAGYRFRARYAWRAALATADSEAQARLKAKIAGGLTQMTAAR